jgi:hypothetical protein
MYVIIVTLSGIIIYRIVGACVEVVILNAGLIVSAVFLNYIIVRVV